MDNLINKYIIPESDITLFMLGIANAKNAKRKLKKYTVSGLQVMTSG